jgi:hypothetical protein
MRFVSYHEASEVEALPVVYLLTRPAPILAVNQDEHIGITKDVC